MRSIDSQHTLKSFLEGVYFRLNSTVNQSQFDVSQQELLIATLDLCRQRSFSNPIADPISIFYLVVKAQERDLDEKAECLGTFCLLYILALDLFDDVQDNDLAGKPHEHAGPAIAINSGITLLFLALDCLRQAMELESNFERRLAYLEVFNRVSLLAASGQHRDLMGEKGANTPNEVLRMQQAKTSSLALVAECAAIFSGCNYATLTHYRRASEQMVLLVQVVDDVRDVFGKSFSPDMATNKMTYLLACFLEIAKPEQLKQFDFLVKALPNSLKQIRKLFYESGAIQKVAETIEQLRLGIHHELAATGNAHAAHRNWLFIIDALAGTIYTPSSVECSQFIQQPEGPWYQRVQEITEKLVLDLKDLKPPSIPPLLPWHLPQWMYDPKRKVIYYPDLEGQLEEILPFHVELLKTNDVEHVKAILESQAPVVIAHEFFHYWRDVSGNLTQDSWHEEWAATLLATVYVKAHHPELIHHTLSLAEQVLHLHSNGISQRGKEILESFFMPDYTPREQSMGYEVSLSEIGLIQLAIIKQLYNEKLPTLPQAVAKLLPKH